MLETIMLITLELEDSNSNTDNFEITIGMEVLVKPFNMVGTVLSLPNKSNEVFVQFGNTKTNVKISNLEKKENIEIKTNNRPLVIIFVIDITFKIS